MSQDKTSLFNIRDIDNELIRSILSEVWDSLEERGYNPVNQLVGYFMSGYPGYISSYKGARDKIMSIERSEILAYILREYLK